MKQLKKIIPVLLLVCLLTICLPNAAAASETAGTCGENLTWSLDAETGVLTISGSGEMEHYSSGGWGMPWSSQKDVITSVVFGENVTSIGDYAFCGMDLTSVTIPENIQRIGSYAFQNCSTLTQVRIEGYHTALGSISGSLGTPFRNCPSVTIYGWSGSDAELQAGYMGYPFVSIGSKQWIDGISNADMPVLDETRNTLTISTPRELAWLSWMCSKGNTLSGYTVKLAAHLDMSGKLWKAMDGFAGTFDGCGYTITGLELTDGGLFGDLHGTVSNLYLKDAILLAHHVMDSNGSSATRVFNCGFSVQIRSDRWFTISNSVMQNCYYLVEYYDGERSGGYYDPAGNGTYSDDFAVYKEEAFLTSLNTLLDGAMMWEFGDNGYPVLIPNSSRSWKDHTVEVQPQGDIYYISTPQELAWIANLVNNGDNLSGKTVKLMANLDLSGKAWTPIGIDYQNGFDGTFDGGNHIISNLMVGAAEKPFSGYAGLFGYCESYGTLKNVTLKDAAVYGDNAGALVGNGRDILNCHVIGGTVSGDSAGGLAQSATRMEDCSTVCKVFGSYRDVGGLVGLVENFGGVLRCYSVCEVTGTADRVGGLVGYHMQGDGAFSDCYAIGTVSGTANAGGLIGVFRGELTRCYAACDVSSAENLPGMLIGGLQYSGNIVDNCYWSTDCTMTQSGIPRTPQGVGDRTDDGSVGVPLTKLKQQSTFPNWDFTNVWAIDSEKNSGLPYLRTFDAVSIPLTGLTISENAFSLAVGSDHWLTVTPTPAAAAAQITWTSSDLAVASVSGGRVTGLKEGTTVIRASSGAYTVSCTVTVTARPIDEYTIGRLSLRGPDGAALTEIPSTSFYTEVTITKIAEADSAMVMLVSYTTEGKMLDAVYLWADVPANTTYSLGAWIDHDKGHVGQVKAFLLSSLSNPLPLAASQSIS